MIKFEDLGSGVVKITAPGKLQAADFLDISPKVDAAIKEHAAIRLLIDASHLEGWDDLKSLEQHASFVKNHQEKVEKIAVLTAHEWQHWLVGAVRVFLHPEVRVFNPDQEADALRWLAKARTKQFGQAVSGEAAEPTLLDMTNGM